MAKMFEESPFAFWSVFVFPGRPFEDKVVLACLAGKESREPDRKLFHSKKSSLFDLLDLLEFHFSARYLGGICTMGIFWGWD